MIRIYDRKNKKFIKEIQYGEGLLKFLYGNLLGRILLKTFVSLPAYSKLHALSENSPRSVKKINPFIEKYNINMEDYEKKRYTSFNDFFTRKMISGKRDIDYDKTAFIAPADSKLTVYNIDENMHIPVKNTIYDMEELLPGYDVDEAFEGGYCLVYRLSVDDYHRYCFIDSGKLKLRKSIKGRLHTVSSISRRYKIYKENHRVYSKLETDNLGEIICMEVGAIQVGRIHNSPVTYFAKGQEKGFFSYGGSTVIILVKKDVVEIDRDIMAMSKRGIETKVKYGEKVGHIV